MSPILVARLCLLGALVATLTGCASFGVRPEGDPLSRPEMAFDAFPVDQRLDEEMYFSKEAASGGRSFGAGGCGCN